VTPIGNAAVAAAANLSRDETNTLEMARQRGRRIRLVAISVGAAILIAFGIKVIVTSQAHRSIEAVEEYPVEPRHPPTAPGVKAGGVPAATSVPEPAPTASVTVPETAGNHPRRLPGDPATNLAQQHGHMKLSVSKFERTSDGTADRAKDRASDHAAEKASEKPAAAPTAEAPRPGTTAPPPAPTAPAAPASRAGKISIDDF